MHISRARRVLIIALPLALHAPALATKPCPPSPCATEGGAISIAKCRSIAAWVATGTISEVVHHEQGYPLLRDFAEFTFNVTAWEKGAAKQRALRFRVAWCENSQPLPRDTSGTFRFFGLPLPSDPSLPNLYIHFEPVQPQRQ